MLNALQLAVELFFASIDPKQPITVSVLIFSDISLTLVLNQTERATLESTERLTLDLVTSSFSVVFASASTSDVEPTLTNNDWFQVNSPAKNVRTK